jgi:DNA mismatch repair protein MutL
VAQTNDGLVIVDQHAAHERIVYERLKAGSRPDVARQILLIPEIVELPRDDVERLEPRRRACRVGLVVEPFGPGAVAVTRDAGDARRARRAAPVRDIADDFANGMRRRGSARSLDHVAATMACHGSVRAGRRSSPRRWTRCCARWSAPRIRPVQPRPPDLCRAEARRRGAAVRRR